MPPATRFLQSNSSFLPAAAPPEPLSVDSDVVVILAALLCALICVVGLALVARCACLRRSSPGFPAPPRKGLKKKALQALPKVSYTAAAVGGSLAECPICLAEFAEGDEIRILPHCGHGFHVSCVDTWLAAHSNCPSCRRVLVVASTGSAATPVHCRTCGVRSGDGADTSTAAVDVAASQEASRATELAGATRFLP
ncbi:probable E3 ubiquitin-protein ligase ATL44 [Zingiber officinale]|uniref:probable E3 ubiquitin-protein ligase ATL44 n=1 Tax=Zingiber officinale TaxID=94328 RepID=UPI001C4D6454|nr:probable E3 ubiquitin-protein ligase ATL44 [Zingiber officinale]